MLNLQITWITRSC